MSSVLEAEVRTRAGERCEYCLLPQAAYTRRFHIEHIVARQHGGQTVLKNLALACWFCNLKKGPNLSGIDPQTGAVVPLFNPREQGWSVHFSVQLQRGDVAGASGVVVAGKTPSGRATVNLLNMNDEFRQTLRARLAQEGLYVVPIKKTVGTLARFQSGIRNSRRNASRRAA